MTSPYHYLVEVGCEELPPTSLIPLRDAFTQSIDEQLSELNFSCAAMQAFASPRRLALRFDLADNKTPLSRKKNWGPPAAIAFDENGEPTKAALAFANKNSIDPAALKTASDGKQEKLVAEVEEGGERLAELLPSLVTAALNSLPIPKRMRWGNRKVEFLRPIQWVTLLENDSVVDGSVYSFRSGRQTRGHRFHSPKPFELNHAKDYETQLEEKGFVIASLERRKQIITEQVSALAKEKNLEVVMDEDLLNEVAGLVERPKALLGKFDQAFLAVPQEALILSMKEHQKYFHALDQDEKLAPYFFFVANLHSKDDTAVIEGNERVIRPRLADAQFFFEEDAKIPLADRADKLGELTFQDKLGSVADKATRIEALGLEINKQLGSPASAENLRSAAKLAKCDLVSLMVYEFPEMQGIAGSYYAQKEGYDTEICAAIAEHYLPKDSTDKLPAGATATVIALADRLDTLVGIFAIGLKPSGSKDPFALRRASVAVLRILTEKSWSLDLHEAVRCSLQAYEEAGLVFDHPEEDIVQTVVEYILDRFTALFKDQGLPAQVFPATRVLGLTDPYDISQRANAVAEFAKLAEAEPLAQANKRVANILAKNNEQLDKQPVDVTLLCEAAEKNLHQELENLAPEVRTALAEKNYPRALTLLGRLKPSVDQFFDSVMVMTDEVELRKNRLRLLRDLRSSFIQIADISVLSAIQAK